MKSQHGRVVQQFWVQVPVICMYNGSYKHVRCLDSAGASNVFSRRSRANNVPSGVAACTDDGHAAARRCASRILTHRRLPLIALAGREWAALRNCRSPAAAAILNHCYRSPSPLGRPTPLRTTSPPRTARTSYARTPVVVVLRKKTKQNKTQPILVDILLSNVYTVYPPVELIFSRRCGRLGDRSKCCRVRRKVARSAHRAGTGKRSEVVMDILSWHCYQEWIYGRTLILIYVYRLGLQLSANN